MIKLTVMYPNEAGAQFDHDYYREKHMPLLKERMGDHCRYYTIEKGLSGAAPGSAPTYVAMCNVYCDSLEAFMAGIGPHIDEITGDVANFTNLTPLQQISEVVVERSA